MGYNVHITRAEDWAESELHPILESEWMNLIDSDSTLQVSDQDYYDLLTKDGSVVRHYVVEWLSHPSQPVEKPYFWHQDGRILKKNPDEFTLKKMAEIARKLNARVVGDEGEELEDADVEEEELGATTATSQHSWWNKLFKR